MDPEFVSNVISTLIGTVAGAALAYMFALRQFKHEKEVDDGHNRIDTALDFFEELTSDDFSRAKSRMKSLLQESGNAKSPEQFYRDLAEEDRQPIRMVLSFFRRLQLAVQYDRIDKQMTIDLFSGEFIRWYSKWLNQFVPSGWDSRQRIDYLDQWLQQNLPQETYEAKKRSAMESKEDA